MGQKQTFVKTVFDDKGNNGLGEWKALFTTGSTDLAKAFGSVSAKEGLKTMGGVSRLNHEQIGHRITELQARGGFDDTVEQLQHGSKAIEAKLAAPKVQATANTGMRVVS